MSDNLTAADRRKTMKAVKSKRTGPERRLFAMLAGMHLKGWRKNPEDTIGKPDVAFYDARIAVFVDGCFWHGCPKCRRGIPQTNRKYWRRKIGRNVERDVAHRKALSRAGWKVVQIWEHELRDLTVRPSLRTRIRAAFGRK